MSRNLEAKYIPCAPDAVQEVRTISFRDCKKKHFIFSGHLI